MILSTLPTLDAAAFADGVETGITLVEFGTRWCPPCKVLLPILEELQRDEAGRLSVYQVDCDASPELAARYGVMSTPMVILFRDGEPVERLLGLRPKGVYEAALARYF